MPLIPITRRSKSWSGLAVAYEIFLEGGGEGGKVSGRFSSIPFMHEREKRREEKGRRSSPVQLVGGSVGSYSSKSGEER